MHKTLSEAINIQVPYNFERFFHFLTGQRDPATVRQWMSVMEQTQRLTLPATALSKLQGFMASQAIDDEAMKTAMKNAWQEHEYLMDPHTAVAVAAAQRHYGLAATTSTFSPGAQEVPCVVLSTAHAAKFEEAVKETLGPSFWDHEMRLPEAAQAVMAAKESPSTGCFRQGEDWEQRLRALLDAPVMKAAL